VRVGAIFENSLKVGKAVRNWRGSPRDTDSNGKPTAAPA
jgi:hypothetical protein